MPSLTTSISAALLVGLLQSQAPVPEPVEWTWVIGHYEDAEQQAAYEAEVADTFRYYQDAGEMLGRVVRESVLEAPPTEPVVFCGSIDAFENADWLAPLPLLNDGGALVIGGIELDDPQTGIFLRSFDKRRVLFSGLSFGGFKSIFTEPTAGTDGTGCDCTIVLGGSVLFEGNFGESGLELQHVPFLPRFPTIEELELALPSDSTIDAVGIYVDDLSSASQSVEFTSEFRAMISELIEDQSVLFVGESHWNRGVDRVFGGLLEELIQTTRVRVVFFEDSFSLSAHFDHYVHLTEETAARRFRTTELRGLIPSGDFQASLELLRRWNAQHPDVGVSLACVDLEFRPEVTVGRILEPYLRWYDSDFVIQSAYSPDYARIRALLDRIELGEFEREHPFLEVGFIRNALQNLEDTRTRESDPRGRARLNVRNITRFHAAMFDEGLAVFRMGAWHAERHTPEVDGYYREAAYLDQVFTPTQGRVKSLLLDGLGIRFDEVGDLDVSVNPGRIDPHGFVQGFQRDLRWGRASPQDAFMFSPELSIYERLVARHCFLTGEQVLWVKSMEIGASKEDHSASDEPDPRTTFDSLVYVFRSQYVPNFRR